MKLSVCAFRLAEGWKAGAEVRRWHHTPFHGISFKSPFNCVQVSNWLIQYWWMHSVCLSGAFNCNLFGKVSHSFSYVLLVALDVFQRKWKNSRFLKFNLLPKKAWRLNANGENHAFGLLHIACGKNSNTAVQFFKSSRAVVKNIYSIFSIGWHRCWCQFLFFYLRQCDGQSVFASLPCF